MSKKLKKILNATLLVVLILLMNIIFWGTNQGYYRVLQTELDISNQTGISEEGLDRITQKLTGYMQFIEEDIVIVEQIRGQERPVFNQKEIDHMYDVKNLFLAAYAISFVLLAIFIFRLIILKRDNKIRVLQDELKIALIISFSIVVLALLVFWIDFQSFWKAFHEIFFFNDLYLLNPSTDVLIQLMPLQFFIKIATRITVSFFTTIIVILLIVRFGVDNDGEKNRSRYSK